MSLVAGALRQNYKREGVSQCAGAAQAQGAQIFRSVHPANE
jgi:hypothetical protein